MYKKLIILVGLILATTTTFAGQNNLIVKSANTEVKVYCAPYEVKTDYKENLFLTVPAGNIPAEKSLNELFNQSTTSSIGCNIFSQNTLLGNFGFVLEKSGLLTVGSAGFLVDTNYFPTVGKSAPDIDIITTFAPQK
ncbi:MAG TPA: hypothetical protein VHE99_07070 [Gammaproteobacteria bacterium]|nr:hypothetical protein [Gammaproteobacteria bacterium]